MKIKAPKNPYVLLATLLLGASTAMAQTDQIQRYSYINGTLNGTFDYTDGFTTPVGGNAPTELAGANWAELFATGQVWGTGHSTLVRAFDWAEDNQVNLLTAGGVATWYFSTNANTNAQSGTPNKTTFAGGHFDGESIIGNSSIIAVYDDQVVLFNTGAATGSTALSLYSINTGVVTLSNFGFDTFTGGALDGLTLESQMGRLIGAEDGYLWYLDPDGSASAYGITSGNLVLDPTWTIFSGGMMDGISLTDAIDSGHYLGIGAGPDFYFTASVIPEPSTVVLLGAAGALLIMRARKRSVA